MKLLSIETSGTVGSVALALGDEIAEVSIAEPREQTERILPIIDELLGRAGIGLRDLDALALGRGPGSFTGLRVAAAVAQGLGLAANVPIVGVSSLAGLAQRAWEQQGIEHALVLIDARMGEVYFGEFRIVEGLAEPVRAEAIGAPETVSPSADPDWSGIGDGFEAHRDALAGVAGRAGSVLPGLFVRARDLLPLARAEAAAGRFVAPVDALPAYLRESSAWRRQ